MSAAAEATFFPTREAFRAWLEAHHASTSELLVGFHRKHTAHPSITWPESVDEALCFGWIDGVRRRIDEERYCIRFTPRKPRSTWSLVNIGRVAELQREGRMRPAGTRAFEARVEERSGTYAYEQRETAALPPEAEAVFRAEPAAWAFFQAQPPGYRRLAAWYVVSAKREATRGERLRRLIADSAAGRRLGAAE